MTRTEQALSDFIEAWNAGQRPDVDEFLQRVPPADRDNFAAELLTWLELAPTPSYDESTRAEISREPALVAAREAARASRAPVAEQLRQLRTQAGLGLSDIAARLLDAVGIKADPNRAVDLLEQLETGRIDERGLSRRLLNALKRILGASATQLDVGLRPASAGQALFRSEDDAEEWIANDIDALSRAALSTAPTPMDDLERLFFGGPDA